MRIDIARAQLDRHQVVDGARFRAVGAEVDHHGNVGAWCRRSRPGRPASSPLPFIVRGLDADDGLRIFERHRGGKAAPSMSAVFCSIGAAAHAGADDVEQGEDAGLRAVDDALFLKSSKLLIAGAARVDHRGDADPEGEAIGLARELSPAYESALTGACEYTWTWISIRPGVDVEAAWRRWSSARLSRLEVRGDAGRPCRP